MFKRFTAAAVSTVLSVSAVLPCTVNASGYSNTKLNPYIVTVNPKNAPDTAAITKTTTAEEAKTGSLGDNITYTLSTDGTLTIKGFGASGSFNASPFGADAEKVLRVIFENESNGITALGSKLFMGCINLKEITVPETVTTIGSSLFDGCTSLKKAVINGGVSNIGEFIFNGCTALEELTLPYAGYSLESVNAERPAASLTNMFSTAEYDNTYQVTNSYGSIRYIPVSLKSITITCGDNIPAFAFEKLSKVSSVTVPDSVKFVGQNAFLECAGLDGFKMPSAVTYIDDSAFAGCAKLDVDIPENTTFIGMNAFAGCKSVKEINVPETVTILGAYAFSGCTSLKKAVIKGCSKGIADFVFNGCTALEELTLPYAGYSLENVNAEKPAASLTNLFSATAYDATYQVINSYGSLRYIPKSLVDITVTGGQNIPASAFECLSGVRNFTLPNTAATVGEKAFADCSGIENVFYPDKEKKWSAVAVESGNGSIEGKVRFLGADGRYTDAVMKLGDVNSDGLTDAVDASIVLAEYARLSTKAAGSFTTVKQITADVNRNGIIDAVDASNILAYYAYISTEKNDPVDMEKFIIDRNKK